MFYQWTQSFLRWRRTVIMLLLIVAIGYGALRSFDILPDPPLCPARPSYAEGVTPDVQSRVDGLFEAGLLYCADLKPGLASVAPTVYWGSDGSRSVVFFQAFPGSTLAGVGVSEYIFDDDTDPPPVGAASPPGYWPDRVGRPAFVNQAGVEDPTWFFREDGVPAAGDVSVRIRVRGPALEQAGLADRDFEQDLERIWSRIQGEAPLGARSTDRVVTMSITPERWADVTHAGELSPTVANDRGAFEPARVARLALDGPVLMRTEIGPTASTVWVAGVVSGTTPAMHIAAPGGAAVEPVASSVWVTSLGPVRLAHFAFEPQPVDTLLDARYWHDGRQAGTAPPDMTWPVVFASKPPEIPTPTVGP